MHDAEARQGATVAPALAAAKSTLDRYATEVARTLDGVRGGDSFLDLDPHERARLMLNLRGAEDATVAFMMDRLQQLLYGGETAEACDRIAALRPSADPRTLPVLAGALLDDARSEVRAEAARAIARIDDRRVPLLLAIASARASEIGERLALAEALGIWGDMRGTEIVRECLADPREALRISALEALYDPTLAELAMASARSGSLDERRAALRAVGRSGDERALVWLDGLVQDDDTPPALAAEIRAARGAVLARAEMRGEAPAELLERTRRGAPRVKALARELGAPPTKRHRFAAWLLMLRAVIARLFGLRETASSLCDRALAADPGWLRPALFQGNLWLASGDKSRAVAGFRRALHIAPAALATDGDVMTRITTTYLARTDELVRAARVEAARALVDELMFLDLLHRSRTCEARRPPPPPPHGHCVAARCRLGGEVVSEPRIRSISIEIETDHGGSTVVVRNPDTVNQRVFVAGPASAQDVTQALERVGLAQSGPSGPMSVRPAAPVATPPPPSVRASVTPPPVSVTPAPDAVGGRQQALPDRLHALCSAVLRVGSRSQTSSVEEAIDAVAELVERQELEAVARLLSRLDMALEDERAIEETTLLLAAIADAVDILRAGEPASLASELSRNPNSSGVPIGATELVDVGRIRERMHITTETRLLVELATGIVYRECGAPSQLSFGPSGRKLVVDSASREESIEPERLRVYQYEFRPAADDEDLERALSFARRSLELPRDLQARPLTLAAVPRAVFLAPSRTAVGKGGTITLHDDDGASLPIAPGSASGAGEALLELVSTSETLEALSGALVLQTDGIALAPWTAMVRERGKLRVVQLSL